MTAASSMVAFLRRLPVWPTRPALQPRQAVEQAIVEIDEAVRGAPLDLVLETLEDRKRPLYRALGAAVVPRAAAKALTLKILNLCLARHHFLRRHAAVLSRPLNLTVDPSNACHLSCPGCVHSRTAEDRFLWKGGMLTEARFGTLLRAFGQHAIHATFCNYGEPLLNPAAPRLIRMAKSHLLATVASTNLSLRRFDAEALVESGLDLLIVSIDGATQPVYERFRRNGDLALVLANLAKLVVAKRVLGKRTPVIAWHFLAFEHNAHEIPAALETARSLGVNQFEVVRPFDVAWDDPAVRPAAVPHFRADLDPDNEEAILANWIPFPGELDERAIDREFDARYGEERPASGPDSRSSPVCEWLYKNITMDAGGRIFPCCCAPQPNIDVVFGDIASPGDFFNSRKYRLARLSFAGRQAYEAERAPGENPYCARCEWNKTWADPNRIQIEEYLKAAGGGVFTKKVHRLLSRW